MWGKQCSIYLLAVKGKMLSLTWWFIIKFSSVHTGSTGCVANFLEGLFLVEESIETRMKWF